MFKVKFWGVRGSVPSPQTGSMQRAKTRNALQLYREALIHNQSLGPDEFLSTLPFSSHSTYGGNTSCVEIVAGKKRIVLDMGTGLRPLGNSLFKEMQNKDGLQVTYLLSHIHWDHIQGLPFFGPLYVNKESGIKNSWHFYGGTNWIETAETVFRGQMDPPKFPVSWKEIEKLTYKIRCDSLHDLMQFQIGPVCVKTRKLNHPQETYGWRLEYEGKVVTYTTDHEPFDPEYPDPRLLDLARGADVWITDCQYSKKVYEGMVGGVPRHGWGHSYPEATARTAVLGQVKKTVLFHHDPSSTDQKIEEISDTCQSLLSTNQVAIAAAEEMEIEV